MSTPEPPPCNHNWPAIAALSLFFAPIVAVVFIVGGGLPIRDLWPAIAWLELGIAFVLAVVATVLAWRVDHWHTVARERAALLRNRDAEIADLQQMLRGGYDDNKARLEGSVRLRPEEHTAFRDLTRNVGGGAP